MIGQSSYDRLVRLTEPTAHSAIRRILSNLRPYHAAVIGMSSADVRQLSPDGNWRWDAACLLPGFPKYPRAKFGGQSVGASGYGCHVVFLTNDRAAAVIAYYKAELDRGSWQVTAGDAGQVGFRLKNGKRTAASGTVTVGTSADGRTRSRSIRIPSAGLGATAKRSVIRLGQSADLGLLVQLGAITLPAAQTT